MKILVTGGAGFIASNVADAYIKAGHRVVIVDNLFMGNMKNVNKKAKFYKADIRDAMLAKIVAREKPDVVNHHAAQISVPDSVRDPVTDMDINIRGTVNVMEASRKAGVKKFIFISSGGTVYGSNVKLPATEDNPLTAESPYGIAKVTGEHYVRFYAARYGMKYTILRYSNVYGPRQIPHGEAGVVAIFIERIMSGKRPVIYGGGKCLRDYVYVGDVAAANVAALKKGNNEAFNIGTGVKTDVNMLYAAIQKATGYSEPAEQAPYRAGDLKANYLNCARAKRLLGWSPKVKLNEGIALTYEYYRDK
ncbi:MAG: NAD-dependent epimerase/dehydratase family protein [Spirochaetia bacterium]|nr:NAD-dependent epimerase/dehydratase family protein [Spirochaetia bacterium]